MINVTMKKLLLGLSLTALLFTTKADANCGGCSGRVFHGSDFSFAAGIRDDYITSKMYAIDKQGKVLFRRFIREKEMTFYTVNANMRYEFGDTCCTTYTWANHFFIRGNVEFGWLGSSRYQDYITNATGNQAVIRARQHKGKVVDGQAGLGYFFMLCSPSLRVGPIAGWGYNLQSASNDKAKLTFNDLPEDVFRYREADGDHFRTRWRGPFLGLDVIYHVCDWSFETGYEFHWMRLHAFWKKTCRNLCNTPCIRCRAERCDGRLDEFHGRLPGFFSSVIRSNNAYSNLVWAKARWYNWDNFTSGFGAVYRETRSKTGRIHPWRGGFRQNDEPEIYKYRLHRVVWRSFEFQVEVGYHW